MRVIIVDGEPVSRTRMRQLLNAQPGIEIAAECISGEQALRAIITLRPDVVFLDVQMPELNGFDVVAHLSVPKSRAMHELPDTDLPLVVFVTAYDEYAVRAFDVLALDYVLKPVAPERLRLACERARPSSRARSADSHSERA